jgi:hypothetical protein
MNISLFKIFQEIRILGMLGHIQKKLKSAWIVVKTKPENANGAHHHKNSYYYSVPNTGANRNIRPQMPPTAMIATTITINPYLAMAFIFRLSF